MHYYIVETLISLGFYFKIVVVKPSAAIIVLVSVTSEKCELQFMTRWICFFLYYQMKMRLNWKQLNYLSWVLWLACLSCLTGRCLSTNLFISRPVNWFSVDCDHIIQILNTKIIERKEKEEMPLSLWLL